MAEQSSRLFPDNNPYLQDSRHQERSSPRPSPLRPADPNASHSPSGLSASLLVDRVQDLEEQLLSLATAFAEEGKQNQAWQAELTA